METVKDSEKRTSTNTFAGRTVELSADIPRNTIRMNPESYFRFLQDMGCFNDPVLLKAMEDQKLAAVKGNLEGSYLGTGTGPNYSAEVAEN